MNCIRLSVLALTLVFQQPAVFAQPSVTEGVPALKVTAPNGASSVLIGSLHIPAEGLRQPTASVMDGAKRYVVEGIPESDSSATIEFAPEALSAILHGRAARADWSRTLTDEQLAVLSQNLRCKFPALSDSTVAETIAASLLLKSAATIANIAIQPCAPQGLVSRDELLERAAVARGLQPLPLETQAQANRQRHAVPEHIYRFQLTRAFTPESREGLRRTVLALNTGAYEEIIQALDDLAASTVDAETYKELMIADRNRAWMPLLSKYLNDGHSIVNVGAAHLPGEDGLIVMLREHGYKVEPILLPSN